jgi:hypothetical protein
MKGQFFILGAILICSLFFMGLPRFAPIIKQPSGDIAYLSSNLQSELPHALNLGLNESDPIDRLTNFTHFLETKLQERNINYTSMWLIIQNQSSTDLNVTGGNFLGEDVSISINVTDGSGSTVNGLILLNGSTNSTTFSSVDPEFNITITFADQEESAEMPRDKTGLYAYYRLTRDDDVIKNLVFA